MFPGLKHKLRILAPLSAGLVAIMLVTALGGMWDYQSQLNDQLSARPQAITGLSPASQGQHKANPGVEAGSPDVNPAGPGPAAGSGSQGSSQPSAPGLASITAPAPAQKSFNDGPATNHVSVISVSLSVNGRVRGSVKLPSDSNQCDVLTQAKAEGVIGSLDMRYDSSQSSYGIYVIDGIGDSGSVWWTYTVNGYSPPGCSHTPVHNGDSVNWQYIKP